MSPYAAATTVAGPWDHAASAANPTAERANWYAGRVSKCCGSGSQGQHLTNDGEQGSPVHALGAWLTTPRPIAVGPRPAAG
jgi:hypothetical protein